MKLLVDYEVDAGGGDITGSASEGPSLLRQESFDRKAQIISAELWVDPDSPAFPFSSDLRRKPPAAFLAADGFDHFADGLDHRSRLVQVDPVSTIGHHDVPAV